MVILYEVFLWWLYSIVTILKLWFCLFLQLRLCDGSLWVRKVYSYCKIWEGKECFLDVFYIETAKELGRSTLMPLGFLPFRPFLVESGYRCACRLTYSSVFTLTEYVGVSTSSHVNRPIRTMCMLYCGCIV